MKLAIILVVVLPLAMCAPSQERALLDNPFVNSLLHIFHADEVKLIVTDLVQKLGSDEREAECEKEANTLVNSQLSAGTGNILLHQAAPLICHSLQELVHFFHIEEPTTTMSPPS